MLLYLGKCRHMCVSVPSGAKVMLAEQVDMLYGARCTVAMWGRRKAPYERYKRPANLRVNSDFRKLLKDKHVTCVLAIFHLNVNIRRKLKLTKWQCCTQTITLFQVTTVSTTTNTILKRWPNLPPTKSRRCWSRFFVCSKQIRAAKKTSVWMIAQHRSAATRMIIVGPRSKTIWQMSSWKASYSTKSTIVWIMPLYMFAKTICLKFNQFSPINHMFLYISPELTPVHSFGQLYIEQPIVIWLNLPTAIRIVNNLNYNLKTDGYKLKYYKLTIRQLGAITLIKIVTPVPWISFSDLI